jgi:hypothetical protein
MTRIIFYIADIILKCFKKTRVYDNLSEKYLKSGVFQVMVPLYDNCSTKNLSPRLDREIARFLEFTSTHPEGIQILYEHRTATLDLLETLLLRPNQDEGTVLYASATVLLDMTASETCIEEVSKLLYDKKMFPFIVGKLLNLMGRNLVLTHMTKLRDLFVGIVLNLTCNVENPDIIRHMVLENDVLEALKKILVDHRHDWPTNGAALALLQFSHLALQESDVFEVFQACQI